MGATSSKMHEFYKLYLATRSFETMASVDMGLVNLRMHEFYKLYNVYFLLCIVSLLLVKGDGSAEIRNRITLCTGALAMGLFLTQAWFICVVKTAEEGLFPVFQEISFYLDSARTMRIIGWRVIPIMGAVFVHAAVHLLSGLRRLPERPRNTAASYLLVAALSFGVFSPFVTARYLRGLFVHPDHACRIEMALTNLSRDADVLNRPGRFSHDFCLETTLEAFVRDTDTYTRQWLDEHPEDVCALLVRASVLIDLGRTEEAKELYVRLSRMPDIHAFLRNFALHMAGQVLDPNP